MVHKIKKNSQIFFWKDNKSMDYMVEGKTPTKEDFKKDFVKIPIETPEKNLEKIWEDFNVGKSKAIMGLPHNQEFIRRNSLSHTTMSVGDIVKKDDGYYIAGNIGWKKLKWKGK